MRNFFATFALLAWGATQAHGATVTEFPAADDRPAHQLIAPDAPGPGLRPMVVVLHGYGVPGELQEYYYQFREHVDGAGFYLLVPEGRRDGGAPHWDVSLRERDGSGRESDLAYVRRIVGEAVAQNPIDPDRVFVIGHSNGGYFATAIACAMGNTVRGVATVSGSTNEWSPLCTTGKLDRFLAVCGTNDGCSGADTAANAWASRFQCRDRTEDKAPSLDLDWSIVGAETMTRRWSGCRAGTAVSQWTMLEGQHIPYLRPSFAREVLRFFMP